MSQSGEFSGMEGFDPSGNASEKSRLDHLYSDVDTTPDAQHHTLGLGPDQAVSYPIAKNKFDGLYAADQHTHPEIAGDNLILNGDASADLANWTTLTNFASCSVSAGKFVSQLTADNSTAVWESNVFTPVANELMSGNLTFSGSALNARLSVYVAWRTDTSDPSVDITLTPSAGTVLDFVGSKIVNAINVDSVWSFSWVVPATALRGRLVLVWDDNTIAAGFPINCYFDDIQLVSNLTTVSKLYVGVSGPQRMEGPLTVDVGLVAPTLTVDTINADTATLPNLFLPTGNQGVGKVLVSDASGQADWGNPSPPISIGDVAPSTPTIGQGWWDTSEINTDPIFFFLSRGGTFFNNPAVSGTWVDITPTIGKYKISIPCDGIAIINYAILLNSNAGQAGILSYLVNGVNCSIGNQVLKEARLTTAAGASDSVHGLAVNSLSSVGANATAEIGFSYFATVTGTSYSNLSMSIAFYPKAKYAAVSQ